MKIKFLKTEVVNDCHRGTENETRFEAGKSYDLPRTSADRWIRRGKAVPDDQPEGEPAPAAPPAGIVQIPPNYVTLSWSEIKALASHFTQDPIPNKKTAVRVIEDELKRRALPADQGSGTQP